MKTESEWVEASAHGRVNLIGEHTDYNDGFVLPAAIPHHATVRLIPRADESVHLKSHDLIGTAATATYALGREKKCGEWTDYVQGITHILGRDGHRIRGFTAELQSSVPIGSGLSSSAALEIAFLRALRTAYGLDLNDVQLAKIGQRVENEFVGAHVGIMDQMAASLAELGSALFIDVESLKYEKLELPPGYSLAVINSGITHSNSGGDYNTRRAECETGGKLLGVKTLRALTMADLPRLDTLPDTIKRRVRHVVTENDRVLRAVQAVRTGDLAELGQLFNASHVSMRDDYQVSVPEIDLLVKLALAEKGTYGARLTGGGFGGSMIVLATQATTVTTARKIMDEYGKQTGKTATLLIP